MAATCSSTPSTTTWRSPGSAPASRARASPGCSSRSPPSRGARRPPRWRSPSTGSRWAPSTSSWAPGSPARQLFPIDAGPGQVVEARLLTGPDGNPLDDTASLVLTGRYRAGRGHHRRGLPVPRRPARRHAGGGPSSGNRAGPGGDGRRRRLHHRPSHLDDPPRGAAGRRRRGGPVGQPGDHLHPAGRSAARRARLLHGDGGRGRHRPGGRAGCRSSPPATCP